MRVDRRPLCTTDHAVLLRQQALVRLAYVGTQSNSNSDVDDTVVKSYTAAGQWKCVQPFTAVR